MFLGFLPEWVGDLSSVLGLPAIVLAILVYVLGRRNANRKLDVEEGTLKKSEFDSYTEAQRRDLADARAETTAAEGKAAEALDRLDQMEEVYDQMREIIHKLRALVRKLINRTKYEMSPEEWKEFEQTKPVPRPPRRPR
jgi:hypothetical protein